MSSTKNPPQSHSSDTSDYDSDTAPNSSAHQLRHVDLSNTIFKAYLEINGQDSSSSPQSLDLTKIQSFLNSSSSGALSCLICLERIKSTDPTWSCNGFCFSVFHLQCIQNWAQQSTALAASRALTRLPISAQTAADTSVWNCPKCRFEYSKSLIPKNYYCFCGKLENPPHDPWVLPHSCGEICGRPLKNNCGHFCLLLCHPGPCPSCPKLVKSKCFCGGVQDVRRCGFKEFSCNKQCNKVLDCGIHRCSEICHNDECPPCREKGVYRCQCGKVKEERECCDRDFRCDNPCGQGLDCGKHVCERGCHEGVCGHCPLKGRRTCPCGRRVYEGIPCDVEVALCGATCDKKLSCGKHTCHERCHRGSCVETCRIMITKSCRCGSVKKQVPCYQDLACERKCSRERDCGRHACRRRCCDGDCPPCTEVCGRRLRCRNHKCPSPCHRGPCAPCPLMVTISCACGETRFEVPCGTETEQKPPRCRKTCRIAPLCRHKSICKPHKCHYGNCPPCGLPCGEEYSCGHACKLRCHGPRPPPNPEFTLKPKKKKHNYQSEPTAGTSCPPCPELVWRSCLGQHFAAERMMVCSNKAQFSCDNLCGNPLACGNHYCTKTCHVLQNLSSSSDQHTRGVPCEDCTLPCQKEMTPACSHPCPQPCHPEECPPCKVLLKRACHCGAMVHVFECIYYNTLSEKEQLSARSCGGPCHRKLPYCTHLCPETCHPGPCPSPEKCCKKVTVRCGCHNLKKEWLCRDVQTSYRNSGRDLKDIPKTQYGYGLLSCDSSCKSKAQAAESELLQRKAKAPEKEIENETNAPKRKKRRGRVQEMKQVSKFQKLITWLQRFVMFIIVLVALVAVAYYGYKGLLSLNDWMNKVEEHREKRRYRRI
ncbi:NF-X1-type zinc finger protein NFXL2-like [Chenopodium quinoa]|uniref:NF-X1-type zinc finger protein NFXL2-like n=1 Tax=Chenopodium quinoa TaxID=63459 RepID=UPI000B77CD85|nr:NF-X1-type zinc finger protein NFXL2-like [Chenopodium quinoa]